MFDLRENILVGGTRFYINRFAVGTKPRFDKETQSYSEMTYSAELL